MEGPAGRLQVDQVEEMLEPQEAEVATMCSVTEAKIRELTHLVEELVGTKDVPRGPAAQ
jgi:hypothetical protein